MKTSIEFHLGIPLGVPREWDEGLFLGQEKEITHKGKYVATLYFKDRKIDPYSVNMARTVQWDYFKTPIKALEWIAKQIKETEDA